MPCLKKSMSTSLPFYSISGGSTELILNVFTSTNEQAENHVLLPSIKACFKRRTFHVPNLMQMSEKNRFFLFALDSAHEKFDV